MRTQIPALAPDSYGLQLWATSGDVQLLSLHYIQKHSTARCTLV